MKQEEEERNKKRRKITDGGKGTEAEEYKKME